jgi:adenine phosphoribosyltransferase
VCCLPWSDGTRWRYKAVGPGVVLLGATRLAFERSTSIVYDLCGAGVKDMEDSMMGAVEQLQITGISDLAKLIRDVPDFPKAGIVFKDITPLLQQPAALAMAIEYLVQPYRRQKIDIVTGAESRGFIFGAAVAGALSAGFVPIRKPGKLPCKTRSAQYQLEYGTDAVEIHEDAIGPGDKVLMVDDLLATGGTMSACCELVESLGGQIVGVAFLIELAFLGGRQKIERYPVHSLIVVEE